MEKPELNVVLDFNQGVDNEVAVIPAFIAKEVMNLFKASLGRHSGRAIVREFVDGVASNALGEGQDKPVEVAVEMAEVFVKTRKFISNITTKNLEDFLVVEEVKEG